MTPLVIETFEVAEVNSGRVQNKKKRLMKNHGELHHLKDGWGENHLQETEHSSEGGRKAREGH